MATEQFNITSLFQPSSGATTIKRKDSGVSEQLSSFKFGSGRVSPPSKYELITRLLQQDRYTDTHLADPVLSQPH